MGTTKRPRLRWGDQPLLDLLIAALFGVATYFYHPHITAPAEREGLYTTAASAIALVGGMGSIAVSVYIAATGKRVAYLRRAAGRELARNYVAGLGFTALSALLCWFAYIVDRSFSEPIAWGITLGSVSLCALTALRQTWLMSILLSAATNDAADAANMGALEAPRTEKARLKYSPPVKPAEDHKDGEPFNL